MAPERLARWLDGFQERHGPVSSLLDDRILTLSAADGAVAQVHIPFPPLPDAPADAGPAIGRAPCTEGTGAAPMLDSGSSTSAAGRVVAHALAPRIIALLLARRGGHAVGVFGGADPDSTKVGRRHVQGRTAAGGWSQQRFARRRAGQTAVAADAATAVAVTLILPRRAELTAVVTGGDRAMVAGILADPRLAPLRHLVSDRFLAVADPRRSVLEDAEHQARAVHIRLLDPPGARPGS